MDCEWSCEALMMLEVLFKHQTEMLIIIICFRDLNLKVSSYFVYRCQENI